jgi:aconitate hydratase
LKDPIKHYDQVIEIDLDTLEPHLVGPHTPDLAHAVSEMKSEAEKNQWPTKLSAALIGSCTNSSYEDIGRATFVAKQALEAGIKMPQTFMVSPGSAQIKNTIERDGQMKALNDLGATVLANACGPCIGQWKRDDIKKGEVNTIVTSFNRNFRGRNDANQETLSFIGSPELVMALGIAGRLDFNPLTDTIPTPKGDLKLAVPEAPELPAKGYVPDEHGYQSPQGREAQVKVAPNSERLQLLTPFKPWDGNDLTDMYVLAKAKGKCTTDHISPAGSWLRYRGHLDNISNNMLLTAVNAFTGDIGKGTNQLTGEKQEFAQLGRAYKAAGKPWMIVGDDNYGEGSSREHAAMSPRHLGCYAVVVKSFARIHETNLKKQGILALTFVNPSDYDKVLEADQVSILGLRYFTPGKELMMQLKHKDGSMESIPVKHTYNEEQIKWFQAGSALNLLRKQG